MSRKVPSTVWIFIAFIPWIAYWSLSVPGLVVPGVVVALMGALALNAYRLFIGNPKLMDGVTLAFFVVHFVFTVVLRSDFFVAYGGVLAYLALALMAWSSLLIRIPFTYQYARDDWPREYWEDRLFRLTNGIISFVWAVIFTLGVSLNLAALALSAHKVLLAAVIPNILLAFGIALSILFPRWFPVWALGHEIRRITKPFGWDAPVFPDAPPSAPDEFDVIVVGAGMGGLTAAALLAKRGLKTLVVEQARYVGGFCANFHRLDHLNQKYVFDIGVHDISGLGPRGPVRWLLHELGLESRLEFVRMSHEYILDGLRLRVPDDADEFAAQLGVLFPAERERIRQFFAEMRHIYMELYADVEKTGGVPGPPTDVQEMLRYPLTHPHLSRWMERSYLEMLDAYFSDARLKKLLCVLTPYLTDKPEMLTVPHMAPIFGYYFDGGFYPKGGSGKLPQAIAETIAANNGTILLGQKVARILVENGEAKGVQLADGSVFRSHVVISNADVRNTFLDLVGSEHLPKKFTRQIRALRPTTSFFAVFLALDYDPPIAPITMYAAPNGIDLGIVVPSKVDPSLAPPGHHVMTIIVLIPQPEAATWQRTDPDYKARKAALADELVRQAEVLLPGLSEHIIVRDAATPATVTRYTGHPDGAIYGSACGMTRLPHQTPIRNLYLAGAGAFPGSGIEAVVISGVIAADAIYRGSRASGV